MKTQTIEQVSDTAIWVAYHRACETERADALFQDRLASKLIGNRGKEIHLQMGSLSRYAEFQTIFRTRIIDQFIEELLKSGIDTILNLGAGLDTRPYRIKAPSHLRWIEVDYKHVVDLKNDKLSTEQPLMQLERVSLDLADRKSRQEFFARVGTTSKKVLVLTEGVLIYLTEDQVSELADDLHAEPNFSFWIADYYSPLTYRMLRKSNFKKGLENAPTRFMPADWFGLFRAHGWKKKEIVYIAEEALRLGRPMPKPWWAHLLMPLMPPKKKAEILQMTAYAIYDRCKNV